MQIENEYLPHCRASELDSKSPEEEWLIQSIWAQSSVGIIGGAPKCCKSWLGLDMAISVASGTPCLDKFEVLDKGPALIYLAEDSIGAIRSRIDALCEHRGIIIDHLNLNVITAPTLRLDLKKDQERLEATVEKIKPRFVLLDPLVRLHRIDENSAAEVSNLLSFFREMQRKHNTAIVLVHHASKKQRSQPGQTLRGSSDLHAFGDCNIYLARKADNIILTLEHRAAKSPDPFQIKLVSKEDQLDTYLEVNGECEVAPSETLSHRVVELLRTSDSPMTRSSIRTALRVNNQKLGETLVLMEKNGVTLKTENKWTLLKNELKQRFETEELEEAA
jgi:hypothetical protein